jgi:hypothetical protein
MGGIFEGLFGGGEQETTVTYQTPPQVAWLAEQIVQELQALRPLAEQAVPDVQQAIQQFIEQYQDWLARAPSYFDEAQRRLSEVVEEPIKAKLEEEYEKARQRTKELSQEVLQDAIRETIRRLSLQGLISQTAGAQAMAEQFRQYAYEPLQRLIEAEAEAKRRLQEQMLRQRGAIETSRLGFYTSLPEHYKAIMQAREQYALTPFELRRSILGTLTGSAGTLQSLLPTTATQTTTGGINPILGGLVGTAGTLGLFKLFGLI